MTSRLTDGNGGDLCSDNARVRSARPVNVKKLTEHIIIIIIIIIIMWHAVA
jgi:t-SNARE complex subunit (syntaxin)